MKISKNIFHDFFYDDAPDRSKRARSATSYRGDHFYSYNTQIGYVWRAGDHPVLFIADKSFSSTTAGHLAALRAACPFPGQDIIRVPFDWDDDFQFWEDNFPAKIQRRFIEHFSRFTEADLKYAARRRELITLYEKYAAFHVAVGFTAKDCGSLHQFVRLAEAAREREAEWAEKRERAREVREQKAAERLEEFAVGIGSGGSIADVIRLAFAGGARDSRGEKSAARMALKGAFPGASFIWTDGNIVRTSQGVALPLDDCRRLYAGYCRGAVKVGMHVGPFEVRELAADYVQIGCHKILTRNIHEVFAAR